MTKEYRAF
ncbi:hypothetical protein D030_1165A, partial [Vibrio parahaemolyticus AQ3810]